MSEEEKLWDTILLYSGVEGYMSLTQIAKRQEISTTTVKHRIENFRKRFPEEYKKLSDSREQAKTDYPYVSKPPKGMKYFDENFMSEQIKEKF